MKIWLASFDIGIKNFAFYIEETDQDMLSDLTPIHKNQRFKFKGGLTPEYNELMRNIYMNGNCIVIKNLDISGGCKKGKYLDNKVFLTLTQLLDSYAEYFDKCSAFIIEQQMGFGKMKINTRALKIGQHVFSYFTIKYMGFKSVIEFEAYHKTQVFGMRKLKEKERKKWSIEMGTEILNERGDNESLDYSKTLKKSDDIMDTLLQLHAFKYLCYVEKRY